MSDKKDWLRIELDAAKRESSAVLRIYPGWKKLKRQPLPTPPESTHE